MPVVGLSDYAGDKKKKTKKEEDDESKRNELYTGGNRRGGGGSGLSVIGPPDDDDNVDDDDSESEDNDLKGDVGKMFSRAQQEKEVPPASAPKRVITMYRNGFTVDDGPFRSLVDPANLPFLRDVAEGLVPRELEESAEARNGGAFHLELVDRRGEEWQPPSFTAFGGSGQSLGTTASAPYTEPEKKEEVVAEVKEEESPISVDATRPTTTLQIRLANGTRLKEKFNLTHTVSDLETLVRARSGTNSNFALLSGYPPKPLILKNQTIQDAQLQNASLSQKLI